MPYKYNLNHRFSLLPRYTEWKDVYAHAAMYGITMRTFQNDKSIEVGNDQDIPTERLMKYAKIFNCELDDLINFDVKAKPFKV